VSDPSPKVLNLKNDFGNLTDQERRDFYRLILQGEGAQPEELEDPWKIFTLADAYMDRPPTTYILAGILRLPSLCVMYGAPGCLKSMLLADLAVSVAAGVDFLPPAPWQPDAKPIQTLQASVLWCDFDNGEAVTHERFAALAKFRNLSKETPLFYYSLPEPWLDASESKSIEALALRAQKLDAKLIVIDNLGTVSGGVDENSGQMIGVMSNLRRLSEYTGAAVIPMHHQRKPTGYNSRMGDTLRGHSSIEASIDLGLLVEREEYSDIVTVRSTKTRGLEVLPFSAVFTYERKENGKDLDIAAFYRVQVEDTSSNTAIEKAVKDALTGEAMNKTRLIGKVKELMQGIGVNRVRLRIDRMVHNGTIKAHPGERTEVIYSLPPSASWLVDPAAAEDAVQQLKLENESGIDLSI